MTPSAGASSQAGGASSQLLNLPNDHAPLPDGRLLRIAFSPCPNDTFVFHAWVHGLLPDAPPVAVTFADVDVTNTAAERGEFDVVKVSYAALPWLLDRYALLPTGGALGRGCGPLVLTAGRRDLRGAVVGVPGERTTAYLLFRMWARGRGVADIRVLPYAEIMPAVRDGRIDAGLVIHEARFTYPAYGLECLADLGEWWESTTGLPIPLGAIVARRELDVARITDVVRASVRYARAHPSASAEFVAQHAQEMDPAVQARHIALYVNDFTVELGEGGYAAVRGLLTRAADAGLVPTVPDQLLMPVI
ncbi:MAG: 1,4-dihydroxy-6-naphthoate synthase [Acidothermus cellulolyticus]|nr:1,4-dihydroxy-6-naphthoate synthase [Acidothermus cellulolyticus]